VKLFNENFNEIAPKCFFYWGNAAKCNEISAKLRINFFANKTIDKRSFDSLSHLISDGLIEYPVHKFVHLVTNHTDVYYYKMLGEMTSSWHK
jgi:hypothetical protein